MDFKTGHAFIDMNEYNRKMKDLDDKQNKIDVALKQFRTVRVFYLNDGIETFKTTDDVINKRIARVNKEVIALRLQSRQVMDVVEDIMSSKQWGLLINRVNLNALLNDE